MKKLLVIVSLLVSIFTFAQETASSSEAKKIFVGAGFSYMISENQQWGLSAGMDYFINNKFSLGLSYAYLYSQAEIKNDDSKYPTLPRLGVIGATIANNHFHFINIIPAYYFIGGSDASLSVYAGAGPSLAFIRSEEYTPGNRLGKWQGLFLGTRVGVDYLMGPGKVFAEGGINTRMFYFGTDEAKHFYEYNIALNIGYRIGF